MATLQKFKHFAAQCGAASTGNPTHSPTTSPVVHLRRRKTLRMLLSRGSPAADHHRRAMAMFDEGQKQRRDLPSDCKRARRRLKDLFVSSSPPLDDDRTKNRGRDGVRMLTAGPGEIDDGASDRGVGSNGDYTNSGFGRGFSGRRRGLRQGAASFRCRLLRRAWRPVLVTIPE
ncbi:unnamed protein product [Linum tenue]|uniref:Uncharacterized protein n=1 Tax=Linum tenue TaxID=586396 RepID=A0AAV0MXL7_9ROSI|nr:unnamed protein product [Linum tenue]